MFKSLIEKIQKEGTSTDPTFAHGPGVASPKLREASGKLIARCKITCFITFTSQLQHN